MNNEKPLPLRVVRRINTILNYIKIKGDYQRGLLHRDLGVAVKKDERGEIELNYEEITAIINRYPLARNHLLVSADLDEGLRYHLTNNK